MELSRDLCLLLEHFTGDHYGADTRTSGEKREIRGIVERYLKSLADGETDAETLLFAQKLAATILITGGLQTFPKKRPSALLRAIGLSGHTPTVMDELAYDVTVASAFGNLDVDETARKCISEDQVIHEYKAAGKIDLETRIPGEGLATIDDRSIKKGRRRASNRK